MSRDVRLTVRLTICSLSTSIIANELDKTLNVRRLDIFFEQFGVVVENGGHCVFSQQIESDLFLYLVKLLGQKLL